MESLCSCGKTANEHRDKFELSRHHYWYMHRKFMPGCVHCNGEGLFLEESDDEPEDIINDKEE